jgi:aspartyl-tRNA(Asn)/glutamyl-tRNA(Gln) amidotransferase subunit B
MAIPTIGLEIHAELNTKSKMFCACKNDALETKPNTNICPICLAHPGVMPTMNRAAMESVIKLGYAVGGKINEKSHFDRKSYFYPDLPKGYQISQYDEPLVTGGNLTGIRIKRVHLEEDTASSVHSEDGETLIDYNRSGVPLMELVTEPDIKTSEEAERFAKELQLILKYLGISDADMERGQMRVEVNISIRNKEEDPWGTKVEIKNLNSFRAVRDSILYEIERQEEMLRRGEVVLQETRGWNDARGKTESQRAKESAHDYRYFPEPDLPPLDLSQWDLEKLKNSLPELPEAKRTRFVEQYSLSREQAEILTAELAMTVYFENAVSELKIFAPTADPVLIYNYLTSDLRGLMNASGTTWLDLKIQPNHLARLVSLILEGKLQSRTAKDLLVKMLETGEDPEELATAAGLRVIGGEDELLGIAEEIISKNSKAVEDFKKGKENALQFLVGQGMAKTKGQASPDILREVFRKALTK